MKFEKDIYPNDAFRDILSASRRCHKRANENNLIYYVVRSTRGSGYFNVVSSPSFKPSDEKKIDYIAFPPHSP